jgi:hypothetical protein
MAEKFLSFYLLMMTVQATNAHLFLSVNRAPRDQNNAEVRVSRKSVMV